MYERFFEFQNLTGIVQVNGGCYVCRSVWCDVMYHVMNVRCHGCKMSVNDQIRRVFMSVHGVWKFCRRVEMGAKI